MSSKTSKASVLGFGAALTLVLGLSSAGALEERDSAPRQTVVKTAANPSTPVSEMQMPLCAWRHCEITL